MNTGVPWLLAALNSLNAGETVRVAFTDGRTVTLTRGPKLSSTWTATGAYFPEPTVVEIDVEPEGNDWRLEVTLVGATRPFSTPVVVSASCLPQSIPA